MRQGQGEAGDHGPSGPTPVPDEAHPGAADPGWRRISWDEALDTVCDRLRALEREHGVESVVFSSVSPSTSAIVDCVDWIQRLQRAFGSPNFVASMELCGWGRYFASLYTYGAPVPGAVHVDLERAECILFWCYNPSVSRLAHATATRAALRRGAKLIVVDPRRAGLAGMADPWLRVRPGTDASLALAISAATVTFGVRTPLVPTVRHQLDDALADQVTVKSGHHLPPGARPYRAVLADRGIDGVEAPWDGPGRRWLEKLELPNVEREIVDVCAVAGPCSRREEHEFRPGSTSAIGA